MSFQIGDVVTLKSGGPKMTVKIIKDGEVWCVWFDGEKLSQPQWFEPEMLEKVDATKSRPQQTHTQMGRLTSRPHQ